MAVRRSILIFEYLIASPRTWRDASASMQREATSMLASVVSDFARLPDVRPVVLVAADVLERVTSSGQFPANVEILSVDDGPAAWLAHPLRDPETLAATMVIAPESGGILVSLLQQLQTGRWQVVPNLNVSWTLAEIFTDKYRTFEWLQQHGLPTPVTKAISVAGHGQLKRFRGCEHLFTDGQSMPKDFGLGVLKPRDGVGCDGISFIQLSGDEFSPSVSMLSDELPWLLQEYVSGVPCSVGFIGGRGSGPATILPPATQNLRLQNGQPVYCGGRIPCEVDLLNAITPLAEKLASALSDFSGYLGADVVVGTDSSDELVATVIEINPRLCSSYAGYRRATVGNLAELILRGRKETQVLWNTGLTEFDACD